MNKIYKFRIEIVGLEKKIWREIELDGNMTIADLAYAIMVSFNSLCYHLFNFEVEDTCYSCGIDYEKGEDMFNNLINDYKYQDPKRKITKMKNATIVKLDDINFEEGQVFRYEYDLGSTTDFNITIKKIKSVKNVNEFSFPNVVNGKGYGMIDDIHGDELADVVKKYCKENAEPYFIRNSFNEVVAFNYSHFNLETNQTRMKLLFKFTKDSYEIPPKNYY